MLSLKGLEWLVIVRANVAMPMGAGYQQVSYSEDRGNGR